MTFSRSAHVYDVLYEKGLGKDYAAEAAMIAALVPDARSLLDVACGTGLHLQHLATRFDCVGVDVEPGMVAIARERCPGVEIVEGDLVDFDLGRTFDAVVCLFSSIGYAGTDDGLRRAVGAMARHVAPGGTLVVEPWFRPEQWEVGRPHVLTVDEPDVKVCRMSVSSLDGDRSVIEFHYLVATADGVEHLTERHEMGLFTWAEHRAAFEAAGLDVEIDESGGPMGRGLVTGRRPG